MTVKKINVQQLAAGMFISDLNCGWLDHPFLVNSFLVRNGQQITRLVEHGIREVYIDTERGKDLRDAPSREEINAELDRRLIEEAAQDIPPRQHGIGEEMRTARRVRNDAVAIMRTMLQDVRLGRQLEVERLEPVVAQVAGSILRNPHALLTLNRIKQADAYTFEHSVSVCALLVAFCNHMDGTCEATHDVGIGALLHDLGKALVPPEILNKPDRLTEDEFAVMKRHVDLGAHILENTPSIPDIAIQVVEQHHERTDGSGYPRSLRGGDIGRYGRMAAIVDVYDALTSERIYHRRIEPTLALRKLLEWSNYHFDETLVGHFIRAVGIYPVGSLVRLASGRLAVVTEQRGNNLLRPLVRVVFDTRRDCPILPKDLDLAHAEDEIVGFETPGAWKLDPMKYL